MHHVKEVRSTTVEHPEETGPGELEKSMGAGSPTLRCVGLVMCRPLARRSEHTTGWRSGRRKSPSSGRRCTSRASPSPVAFRRCNRAQPACLNWESNVGSHEYFRICCQADQPPGTHLKPGLPHLLTAILPPPIRPSIPSDVGEHVCTVRGQRPQ